MITAKKSAFDEAAENLTFFTGCFKELPFSVKERTQEIRLRSGQFITLELGTDRLRLNERVSSEQLEELIKSFCNYSLYSYSKQLSEGYLTLAGGHRAGFAGTAVIGNGGITSIRDITSINIRIAKEYKGCSDKLFDLIINNNLINGEEFKGLLIIGRPLSAKTTILRDLIRNISEKNKISVIDERGEIAAKCSGYILNDLGPNTDVMDAFPKADGFVTALRALSPEYIACDEIGQDDENVLKCINNGVKLILTAHSSGMAEAVNSPSIGKILSSGGISHVAQLGTGKEIGNLISLWKAQYTGVREGINANGKSSYSGCYCCGGYSYRSVPII